MLPSERTVHSRSRRSVCLHLWGEMLGGVGAAVGGGGGGGSKRRHSTQSLSLLYRPSKPDIDLIRDHTRRGSTCGTAGPATGPSGLTESVAGSFLGLRRHSEVVSPSTSTSPVGGGGRQVRLSIDSGRVVQEFHFVKRGFFKSADQIYNKVFGGAAASGGSGSSSSAGGGTSSSTADAYAQHYGGSRSRSKSFNALGGGPLINATSPGGVVADFSSLGQAIESHLRNQLRRATFSNINDGGVATAGSSAAAASLQPTSQRPRSHSTCVVSFPTIIVTQEPQVGGSGGSSSSHHPQQPTQSLVRTEYENKTQVILEESSPCSSSNNNSSATSGGTSSSATLCGLVREILARTFSVGVGFIRGHHPPNNAAAASSNKRFFF